MVAQAKPDARSVAGQPDPAGRKVLPQDLALDGKEVRDDQAAAAAVVDREQADALAAQMVAATVPTDAPVDGMDLLAQATPAATDPAPMPDASTTGSTGTPETTPPPVAEEAAGYSPWLIGGAAILGVGAVAAVAHNSNDNNDDNPSPPAAGPEPAPAPAPGPEPAPGPAPGPAPAPNVAPTSAEATLTLQADHTTPFTATTFPFADANPGDTLKSVKIGTITATPVDTTTDPLLALDPATGGHGYELVQDALTWEAARDAAIAKGGHLAILNSEAEALFIKGEFELGDGTPQSNGTWVGAFQAAGAATPGAGWTWVDGTVLAGDSPFWTGTDAPADFSKSGDTFGGADDGQAQYGAIFETFAGPGSATEDIMYDYGVAGQNPALPPTDPASLPLVTQYLIEYDNPGSPLTLNGAPVIAGQVVQAADLPNLTWNSVFNSGGTVTFDVSDSALSSTQHTLTLAAAPAPAPVPLSSADSLALMIEDQNPSTFV